ncbi:Uncharacterised protein [Mycobacteroides abscessus subsp. abscessus]|nr:Uncharacterised protein [Mycobacteroides abscessus subsp. abscessus]
MKRLLCKFSLITITFVTITTIAFINIIKFLYEPFKCS